MAERRSHVVILSWWGLAVFALGIVVNVLIQISPMDAVSNLSKWVHAFGFQPPKWLEPAHADQIARIIGICLMIVGAAWAGSPILFIILRRVFGAPAPAVAAPDDRLSRQPTTERLAEAQKQRDRLIHAMLELADIGNKWMGYRLRGARGLRASDWYADQKRYQAAIGRTREIVSEGCTKWIYPTMGNSEWISSLDALLRELEYRFLVTNPLIGSPKPAEHEDHNKVLSERVVADSGATLKALAIQLQDAELRSH